MLNFFKKNFEYHFFLPSEFAILKDDLKTRDIEVLFKQNNLEFDKIKSLKVGVFLYFISVFCSDENKIKLFEKQISQFKELVPPWIAFPDLFQGSPRWNQGFEEYYGNVWSDFFVKIPSMDKNTYLLKYDCPEEWEQWLKEVKYL